MTHWATKVGRAKSDMERTMARPDWYFRRRPIIVADDYNHEYDKERCFVLWFGAYGSTYVLSPGHLEDALESAAAMLPKGHFDPPDYYCSDCRFHKAGDEPHRFLCCSRNPDDPNSKYYADVHGCHKRPQQCDETGYATSVVAPDRWDSGEYEEDHSECCEADMTYTESGWIPSYEWGYSLENPTPAELIAFYHGE